MEALRTLSTIKNFIHQAQGFLTELQANVGYTFRLGLLTVYVSQGTIGEHNIDRMVVDIKILEWDGGIGLYSLRVSTLPNGQVVGYLWRQAAGGAMESPQMEAKDARWKRAIMNKAPSMLDV